MINDPVCQFSGAMLEHGLQPDQVTYTNGAFRRFSTNGNKSDKPGFFSLTYDGSEAFGCFGDWSKGMFVPWSSRDVKKMSPGERADYDDRVKEQRQQAQQAREKACCEAAKKAKSALSKMADCKEHPYLAVKGVKPVPGLKLSKSGELVIPIYGPNSNVTSYQRIYEADHGFEKRFMSGGRTKGGWFRIPGSEVVCICEGFATGLSIHEATGCTVVIAFSGGNLISVARQAKSEKIVICADNDASKGDNPGLKYAKAAAQTINAPVAVPIMPTGTQGSDFNDLATISGLEAVRAVIEKAIQKPAPKERRVTAISAADFLKMTLPPRENLLTPWLPTQGIAMIHAYRGVGKTHVSLGVACAVATGSSFLRWSAEKPAGVLFIDGEMPASVLQERISYIIAGMDTNKEAPFFIITPDLQKHIMPDLSTLDGQQQIEPLITDDIKLIVVDNISTLCRTGPENKGDAWVPVQEWALRMRAKGKTVLLVHHDGKSGQQRGTSRKEDVLDTVIQLKHPANYTPDSGAIFEVHFRKSRGFFGKDVKPFEARLETSREGNVWVTQSLENSQKDQVKRLLADGYQQKDIADELGISRGYVSKLVKQIKAETP